MTDPWPFDQPPNCAVFTTAFVMRDGCPITYVYHDEEDHGWQFHSSDTSAMASAMLVSLQEVVKIDTSVLEVADLPPGWMAYRDFPGQSWSRKERWADLVKVSVDWSSIANATEFYDSALQQCDSPTWHGRNLDALADAWIRGGIDSAGPPYVFEFQGSAIDEMRAFREAVKRIARESVEENGGAFRET